jgi:hypothetical protein
MFFRGNISDDVFLGLWQFMVSFEKMFVKAGGWVKFNFPCYIWTNELSDILASHMLLLAIEIDGVHSTL